ncbi:MAG TPA: phospholipase D-like domain-containing protein [Burkholderiaceae bacterium]
MTRQFTASASFNGFSVKAYAGDRCVMLAFNLDDDKTDLLAGFSIASRRAGQPEWVYLGNRIGFAGDYTNPAASKNGKFFSSDTDPYQKFWWLDFPADADFGSREYQVTVKRFKSSDSAELANDQQVQLAIDVSPFVDGNIELGFTRGYLSSQAYADTFQNASYTPKTAKGDWKADTSGLQAQWAWLGGHARQAVIDFFIDCHNTPDCTIDAFVYDLNEPDIINALITLAPNLRILADDASLHAAGTAAAQAYDDIVAAGATGQRGHFSRFQHNKVLIKKVGGVAQKVLTGSTNFSVTGIYVNANHVVVFDNAAIAGQYADTFELAFQSNLKLKGYVADEISKKEFTFTEDLMPKVVVSYAPHPKPTFSLDNLLAQIKGAQSSVIFAVMDLDGSSDVLSALKTLHADKQIFSYGISDSPDPDNVTVNGTTLYTPKNKSGELIFSKADPETFPPPFGKELQVTGGAAHVIHHKFVVVDFNGPVPAVFCGSSNLANGGEEQNGDNLIAIYDSAIATAFAIEGIRLVDHYAFAAALKGAKTSTTPLALKTDADKWWEIYYQDGSIKQTERKLFAA